MKEAAVILKTAIIEHPFQPELTMNSEPVRGLGTDGFPILEGYVGSSAKPRAEVPLVFPIKGTPSWHTGSMVSSGPLPLPPMPPPNGRKIEAGRNSKPSGASLHGGACGVWIGTKCGYSHGQGIGHPSCRSHRHQRPISQLPRSTCHCNGPFRTKPPVRLEQISGPLPKLFPGQEVGAYTVQLGEYVEDQLTQHRSLAPVSTFHPNTRIDEANLPFLSQLAQESQGQLIDPSDLEDDPDRNRKRTFRAEDGWPMLLMGAILLFLDVGIRRIQLEAGWVTALWQWILKTLGGPRAK